MLSKKCGKPMRTFKTFPKPPRVHLNEWNKALVLGKDDQQHRPSLVSFMKSVQTQQDTNGALSMERGPCANSTWENSQENTEEKPRGENGSLSLKHKRASETTDSVRDGPWRHKEERDRNATVDPSSHRKAVEHHGPPGPLRQDEHLKAGAETTGNQSRGER